MVQSSTMAHKARQPGDGRSPPPPQVANIGGCAGQQGCSLYLLFCHFDCKRHPYGLRMGPMLEANGLVFDAVTVRAQCGTFAAMQCRRPHLQLRAMAPFGASYTATSTAPPTRARLWLASTEVRRWHASRACLLLPAWHAASMCTPFPSLPAHHCCSWLTQPACLMTASRRKLTSGHLCTGAVKTPRTASPSAGSSNAKTINLHSGACAACMALLQADARAGAALALSCKGCHSAPLRLTLLPLAVQVL